MQARFYAEEPMTADRAVLTGAEAHHLLHVLRARVGDQVILIDGSGREFTAQIERLGRSQVELAVLAVETVDRELACDLVVGVAWPKAERQRWLIEKLVEVGVKRVVPLRSERSVVHPDERSQGKLQRAVVEASKQCGRNRWLEVGPLTPLAEFLQAGPPTAVRWLADPTGSPFPHTSTTASLCSLAIGPEGGWTTTELDTARAAGWQVVSLGPRILRIETAALVLASLIAFGSTRA